MPAATGLCRKRRMLDSRNDSRGSCALVDDLNAPLGQDKQKRLPRLPATVPQMLAGVLGLSGIVVVAWAAFVSDPLGGEPRAVVATKLAQPTPGTREVGGDGKQHARHDGLTTSPADASAGGAKPVEAPPPGTRTVTIIDGSSGARQQITIPGNPDGGTAKLLDPTLIEATRHGAIPKIGPDGTRPSTRYAQSRQLPPSKNDTPLIAIV